MSTIITRAGKGSPLTNDEVDANFNNLNSTKVETSAVGTLSTQNANAVAITGGTINGATVGATTVAAGSFTTLNSSGNTRLGGLSGNQSLQVNSVASAVNYAQIVGAVTGNTPAIQAQGTDTDVGLSFQVKGLGVQRFLNSAGGVNFQINTQATVANYGIFTATATGVSPLLQTVGSDTNVDFRFRTQGTGSYQFDTTSNANTQAKITNTLSAVNYLNLTGAATGAAPTLSAAGSDANIGLVLSSKGTGVVALGGTTTANSGFVVSPVASSVNYFSAAGNVTTGPPVMSVGGADANISFGFSSKGTGSTFFTTSGGALQFRVTTTLSAVNYVQTTGAATTGAPELSAQGSDANINLKLTPKGTGVLQFGTYTAGALSPTGYITITDAGGTSRRLLVG